MANGNRQYKWRGASGRWRVKRRAWKRKFMAGKGRAILIVTGYYLISRSLAVSHRPRRPVALEGRHFRPAHAAND